MMRVLLINTPTHQRGYVSRSMAGGLGFDSGEAMLLPPLDLAYLASTLRERGHEVRLLDCDAELVSEPAALALAADYKPTAVMATVSLPSLESDCAFLRSIREATGASTFARTLIRDPSCLQELLEKSGAKAAIHGECELDIDRVLTGETQAGTAWLSGGTIGFEAGPLIADLDLLPRPARDLLPNIAYRYPLLGRPVATVQTSRGCPFPCYYYCPYPLVEGRRWRARSPESVYEELRDIVINHGINKVLFRDATFTFDRERTKRICELIVRDHLPLEWWCETRVDRLGDDVLAQMREAGCLGLNVGVETGDEAVMAAQAKAGLSLEKLRRLRDVARNLGLRLHFLLCVGFPQETRRSILATFDLIQDLQPESLGITIITPYPGTPLYEEARQKGWIEVTDWRHYGGHRPVMRTDNLSSAELAEALTFLEQGYAALQHPRAADAPGGWTRADDLYLQLQMWALDGKMAVADKRLVSEKDTEPGKLAETSPELSVVIPTYNRKEVLLKCLESLSRQTIDAALYEVIVVDDGSTDGTHDAIASLHLPICLRWLRQENAGPGQARNRGIAVARGRIVLIMGDDIVPSPNLLEEHLKAHAEYPDKTVAVLGHVAWPPDLEVTPFMKYITGAGGQQFAFERIADPQNAGFGYFYTSNVSVKRAFLQEQAQLFDPAFIYAAHEDIELGYRLRRQGMRLIYRSAALAYHYHPTTLEQFCQRQFKAGQMAAVFASKHPELADSFLGVGWFTGPSRQRLTAEDLVVASEAARELEKLDLAKFAPINIDGRSVEQLLQEFLHSLYGKVLEEHYARGLAEGLAGERGPNQAQSASDALRLGLGLSSETSHSTKPLVSIIIPVYNKVEYTRGCLSALARTVRDVPCQVIVVDNGSTDDTPELLRQVSETSGLELRVIRNHTNLGFAKACNQGAASALGSYLVFLNNDTTPQSGWLEGLLEVAQSEEHIGVVGSLLLYPDGTIQHAGMVFNEDRLPLHLLRHARPDDFAQYLAEPRDYQMVTGACMLVRSELFASLQGFDENYVNGYEDVDLCLRARQKGYRVVYAPKSVLTHFESTSEGRSAHESLNQERFLRQWGQSIQPDEARYLAVVLASRSGQQHVQIKWGGNIFDFSGYSRLSRQAILALDRRGVHLDIQFLNYDEQFLNQLGVNPEELLTWQRLLGQRVNGGALVCFHPPTLWNGIDIFALYRQRNPGLAAHVGITMFETDRLPAGWAAACNQMDEIWVPSTFNRHTFSQAGVDPARLQVIPFGIDTGAYDPGLVRPMEIAGRRGFAFLSTFQWSKRKGWDVLLKAYLSAFTAQDDVCLVLRTYPDRIKTPPIGERIERYVCALGYDPRSIPPIILLEDFIPEQQMPALYAATDAYVLPTRGEGWGIPFMEAMAMGLPVIATRWSAHLDFMNDDNSYLVDIKGLVPVDPEQTEENPYYTSDQRWAEPSVDHTAALMRRVYENREEAKAKGARARWHIQANWSIARTAQWIEERVRYLMDAKPVAPRQSATRQVAATDRPSGVDASIPARPLFWHAPIFDPSGYADEARQFILGLDSLGVNIRAVPLTWSQAVTQLPPAEKARLVALVHKDDGHCDRGAISVFHIFPPYFRRVPGAVYHVGRTMYETDRIPEEWVAACNQMDEIWVPSGFNLETFARAGVRRDKLVKMHGGIAVEPYRLDAAPLPLPGRRGFNFLSVFDWQWRKGWDVLLQAFLEEFRPDEDVALILKVWSAFGRTVEQLRDEAASFLRLVGMANELPPNVVFYQANLPTEQLPGLYRAVNAFVLPTRGEGWGRPFMEAMLMGLPVIGTRWSGHLEFMNDENSYLVDCRVVDVPRWAWEEVHAFKGHRWAEPSKDHLRRLMRQVFEDRQGATRKGQAAREHIVANFSRERVAQQVKERLDIIGQSLDARAEKRRVSHVANHPIVREGLTAVVWEGSQFVHHSLALINRELCLRLAQDRNVDLSIIPYEPHQFGPEADQRFRYIAERLNRPLSQPADVHVRHQWPPNLNPPSEGHWVIIQPWEYGSIPKHWVEVMSAQVDEVWVPSNYVRQCYIRSGVPADRVHVVPNGVDTTKFRPEAPPLALKTRKRFKFLFVGGTIWRKGIDILLKAYTEVFTGNDDVCLVIKDMGGQSFYKGQTADDLIAQCRGIPNAPEIEYIDRTLNDQELAGLYTACDCLVHPYRGEGFGLPIAEAMASGLPVIVTNHGAALDFCNKETAFLIPAQEMRKSDRRVGDLETVDYPWWGEPDVEALKRLLRHVYENPAEAKLKGKAGCDYVRTNFTWDHAAKAARRRLEVLRGQPIQRFVASAPLEPAAGPNEAIVKRLVDEAAKHEGAGKLEQALTTYRAALELAPTNADTVYHVGRLELLTGQHASAIARLEQVVCVKPDHYLAHALLGLALQSSGDGERAVKHLEKAVANGEPTVPLLRSLADAYLASERFAEALPLYNLITETSEGDVNDLVNMAECLRRLGYPELARAGYELALEMKPGLEAAVAGLNALQAV